MNDCGSRAGRHIQANTGEKRKRLFILNFFVTHMLCCHIERVETIILFKSKVLKVPYNSVPAVGPLPQSYLRYSGKGWKVWSLVV